MLTISLGILKLHNVRQQFLCTWKKKKMCENNCNLDFCNAENVFIHTYLRLKNVILHGTYGDFNNTSEKN